MRKFLKTEIFEEHMKQNKLSKAQFCKMCNISVYVYNKMVSGKNFKLRALLNITNTLNIEIYKLII